MLLYSPALTQTFPLHDIIGNIRKKFDGMKLKKYSDVRNLSLYDGTTAKFDRSQAIIIFFMVQ